MNKLFSIPIILQINKIVKYIKKKGGETYYDESVTERQKVRGMGGVGLNAAGTEDEDEPRVAGG